MGIVQQIVRVTGSIAGLTIDSSQARMIDGEVDRRDVRDVKGGRHHLLAHSQQSFPMTIEEGEIVLSSQSERARNGRKQLAVDFTS